jgi:hypothetical protein
VSGHKQLIAPAGSYLLDEGGMEASWLADEWSIEDLCDEDLEFGHLELTPESLTEIWFRPRWTTPEELSSEDTLYELFGDRERGIDTRIVYDRAEPNSPGAHRYWTTS